MLRSGARFRIRASWRPRSGIDQAEVLPRGPAYIRRFAGKTGRHQRSMAATRMTDETLKQAFAHRDICC